MIKSLLNISNDIVQKGILGKNMCVMNIWSKLK